MSEQHSKIVKDLKKEFHQYRDADAASAMSAYMRGMFSYVGISSPRRKELQKPYTQRAQALEDPIAFAELLWQNKEREYKYVACDFLESIVKSKKLSHVLKSTPTNLKRVEKLGLKDSWWDTVDALFPKVSYFLLKQQSNDFFEKYCRTWIESNNIWLQRGAILMNLTAKTDTRKDLLFELIMRRADSREFFVQKGAGWALREYSKVDPKAVRTFIDANKNKLSNLTVREGGKYC